nr:DUF4097 family beta strand repeat-containing protein [Phytoactinopolyspora mesophila]
MDVSITSRSGHVEVLAADVSEAEVHLRPSRSGDTEALAVIERATVEQHGNSLRVEVSRQGTGPSLLPDPAIDIQVTVPQASTLTVHTGSANIRAGGGLAETSLHTGSGNITAIGCTDVLTKTGSGDIQVDDVSSVRASSGSGNVNVERCAGRVDVNTASGDVRVTDLAGDSELRTASGNVEIGSMSARVTAKTASGDVRVQRTVEGTLEAKTASGDVTIGVASGTAAKLDCSAVSGRVRSDLAPTDAPADGDRTVAVSAKTVSGAITVTRSN